MIAPAGVPGEGREVVYLHAGQVFAAAEPYAVSTILGSCVAVCLHDPVARAGGMNHYLLPYRVGDGHASARFGTVAVKQLIGALLALGCTKPNLRAKLFGGARVLEGGRAGEPHLGLKNVEVALELLRDEGIPVVDEDVGGRHGRKLIFQLDDGTAWIRRI